MRSGMTYLSVEQLSSQGYGSSAPDSQVGSARRYRPAKALPAALSEHCRICFEEGLYSQALGLIATSLESGTSDSVLGGADVDDCWHPAYVPSARILALVGTIAVHPSTTNRASSPDKVAAADQALQLLQHLAKLVGPGGANLQTAFAFATHGKEARVERHQKRSLIKQDIVANSPTSTDVEDDDAEVRTEIARGGSLWARAENFWHMVGWAFNCSVICLPRWSRWKHWLQFMLDVLEDDWDDRSNTARETYPKTGGEPEALKESIIMQYLQDSRFPGRSGRRKIMRAILARGEPNALAEFRQIWPKETEVRKKKELLTTTSKLNLDEGQFGDYYEDDDDEDVVTKQEKAEGLRTSSRQRARTATPDRDEDDEPTEYGVAAFGGQSSLLLRRRIMVLLSRVSLALPNSFCDIEDIYELYTEFIRPLPFCIFTSFTIPSIPFDPSDFNFSPSTHSSLCQMLLRPLLARDAPPFDESFINQDILTHHYLHFAANSSSVSDNAKVAVLLESLLRLLRAHVGLRSDDGLFREQIQIGIAARQSKAFWFGGKRSTSAREEEADAQRWLDGSGFRLDWLASMVQAEEKSSSSQTQPLGPSQSQGFS